MEIYAVGYNYKHTNGLILNRTRGFFRDDFGCFVNYYTMILTHTSGTFQLNDEEVTVPPYSFILFEKNHPQHFKSRTTYIHSWIHFTLDENEVINFYKDIEMNKFYFFEDARDIIHLFELLNQEFYSENLYKLDSSKLYFDLIFKKIIEQLKRQKMSSSVFYKEDFNKLRADIYNFPSQKWTIDILAERVGISESYFSHLYKKYFGVSAISDVINSRIKMAKILLVTTTKTLSAIAEELGYNSTTLFTRQFKSVTSLSPGDFRKKNMLYNHAYAQQEDINKKI